MKSQAHTATLDATASQLAALGLTFALWALLLTATALI